MKNATTDSLNASARVLRKQMTDAEKKLWKRLRGEQLGVKFRRQHPFQNFVLDFVCIPKKLVIEVDGSQHVENAKYDEFRTQQLQYAGFVVLRFWNNQVLAETDSVIDVIWDHLNRSDDDSNSSPP